MKPEYRFTPMPLETNVIFLFLSYVWFFLWFGRSLKLASIIPSLYAAFILLFIVAGALSSGEGRKYLWSRITTLLVAMLPLLFTIFWRLR